MQRVFDHSGSAFKTVGSYAVIDFGFDIVHADGSKSPEGAILRQAHKRNPGPYSLFSEEKTFEIERVLRRYEITSGGAYMPPGFNLIKKFEFH